MGFKIRQERTKTKVGMRPLHKEKGESCAYARMGDDGSYWQSGL